MTDAERDNPEAKARRQIDAMLVAAGWDVQDRAAIRNLSAAPGVAIRELTSGSDATADAAVFTLKPGTCGGAGTNGFYRAFPLQKLGTF